MKRNTVKNILVLFLSIFILFYGASGCKEKAENPVMAPEEGVRIDIKEKLKNATCRMLSVFIFKISHEGQSFYIGRDGNISEDENFLMPFQIEGTGVLLQGNKNQYLGTVAHLVYVDLQSLITRYNKYSDEVVIDEDFLKKITTELNLKGMPENVLFEAQPILKRAWIILPNTPTENIIDVLEQDPYKVPDVCYEVVKAHRHTYLDLAILKVKSKVPIKVEGLNVLDFVEEREYKELEEREAVISEGYPKGSMQTTIIKPQPSTGIVTKKTAGELQLSLDAESGSSGSFILSEKQNKIVGIINKYDPENFKNIFAVPANDFRILFEEILESPAEQQ